MNYTDLALKLDSYKIGRTDRSWKMSPTEVFFGNEYIQVVRVDSSNHHISASEMEKQWSIIFEKKKDFSFLPGCRELCAKYGMKITPVNKGANKGCFGFRFYRMKQDLDTNIVLDILNFIFQ